jgi:peptide/nickel transport system permease protein
MPVVLWTDALIFLLLGVVIAFAIYAHGQEHLRAPWQEVACKPLGMVAATVLLAYLGVALIDSLHFHPRTDDSTYSPEVISVLDWLATPLREHTEKTYAAPFATELYSKETIELSDGKKQRVFPRLRYGGAHLQDPQTEQLGDIASIAFSVSGIAFGLWAAVYAGVCAVLASKNNQSLSHTAREILAGRSALPWRAILITLGALIWIMCLSAGLGTKYHIFGTDKVGQDVFYQALKGVRTGLLLGTLTTLIMLPFAVFFGITAGYFRGWVDDLVQYVYTTLNSIPGVLLIAAAVLMLQAYMANHAEQFNSVAERADLRLLFLCVILGIKSWTGLCRLLRAETLKLRELEYVQAAQAFGVGHISILLRHLLPNVMHIVLITVVLDFSGLVLAEAVLSYIGIGVDPSMESWGNMINSARLELAREPMVWWSVAAAFTFMFTLVLAANLFSDAVRDAFDPRLRSSVT